MKRILSIFNRAQAESKKDIAREESRRNTLIADLAGATGLDNLLDTVESRKKSWEKEDKREEAIKSFLDL